MISEKDKYQNLVAQIHELNRQNLLNENEKLEHISQKIDNLANKTANTQVKSSNKVGVFNILLTLINTALLVFLIFFSNASFTTQKKQEALKEEQKEDILPEKNEDALSFDEASVEKFKNESFQKINPIIRKGTAYTCKGENTVHKIPYTVEIKGRLYSDKFTFILQENSKTKECTIKKENM